MISAYNLPDELLLTTRQTTKLRNAIENNIRTDIKLSKANLHLLALYEKSNEVIYFHSFGVNMFLKKSKDLLDIKT